MFLKTPQQNTLLQTSKHPTHSMQLERRDLTGSEVSECRSESVEVSAQCTLESLLTNRGQSEKGPRVRIRPYNVRYNSYNRSPLGSPFFQTIHNRFDWPILTFCSITWLTCCSSCFFALIRLYIDLYKTLMQYCPCSKINKAPNFDKKHLDRS